MSLVLTRREQESIVIGENIRVTVVSIVRGQVKFAIDAPREVPVDRQEIRERKMAEVVA